MDKTAYSVLFSLGILSLICWKEDSVKDRERETWGQNISFLSFSLFFFISACISSCLLYLFAYVVSCYSSALANGSLRMSVSVLSNFNSNL